MNVLVLGGSGYIGSRLVALMRADGRDTPVCASRHTDARTESGSGALRLDTRDEAALTDALYGMDAVVNCVTGSASAIVGGAYALARAARAARVPALVHLSSMVVYGEQQHVVDEASPLGTPRGWYARAKQTAERQMLALARSTSAQAPLPRVTVLRPGCVWGPGSALWVGRIVRWLRQGRLGDLGEDGDGWTHGVLVDDVCQAVLQALRRPAAIGVPRVLNLAAPDSPRWNTWFTDLALAMGATPLRRIRPSQLRADACLLGPPLHATGQAMRWLARYAPVLPPQALPEPITPGLLRLWRRQLKMDASAATHMLDLAWTPYPRALQLCVAGLTTSPATVSGAGHEPPETARAR
jgi:nucleoside-diphosphate-sugar epimerase